MQRVSAVVAVVLAQVLFVGCGGGGRGGDRLADGPGRIAGIVVKGPVNKGQVQVFRLDTKGERGAVVGKADTDEAGRFTVEVGADEGPFLLVVSNGLYIDEASGLEVPLGSKELTALIPAFETGTKLEGVGINAVTHLTAGLSLYYVRVERQALADAHKEAKGHLQNHFGSVDWSRITPADLTASSAPTLDDAAKAGLLNAALSQQAATISKAAGRTVSSLELLGALYEDVSYDGYFDGRAADPLILPKGMEVRSEGPTATVLSAGTVRFGMARAIEDWLANSRNKATFPAADARQIQDDLARASNPRCFRTPGELGYDNKGPELTWEVTYQLQDETQRRVPVGDAKLVGGTLGITVTTKDLAGVKSLDVRVNGAPLQNLAAVNSAYTHTGTWPTREDGDLVITATAVDLHGNVSASRDTQTTFTAKVDNTKPAYEPASLSPAENGGFYTTAIPVEARATDANGVVSLVARSGDRLIPDDDQAAPAHLKSTWTVQAEGRVDIDFSACDPVGNCEPLRRSINVDTSAPRLTLHTTVDRYTDSSTLNLVVAAADAAGIQGVYWQLGGTPQAMTRNPSSGRYEANITLNASLNQIQVWGVDTLGNTGQNLPAGETHLTLETTVDTADPIVTNLRPTGGYLPETNIRLASAAVPPVYDPASFPGEVSLAFGDTGAIAKTSVRLGWQGVTPDAQELLSSNASNTPFLAFQTQVPEEASAPIAGLSYQVSCTGCVPEGNASYSAPLPAGLQFMGPPTNAFFGWLLPLNGATVPFLARLSVATTALTVRFCATDAARNEGCVSGTMNFHMVAPPVVATLETSYHQGGKDPQSAYGYRISAETYDDLFSDANPSLPDGNMRVLRINVRNPFPQPVVATVAPSGDWNWRFRENWQNTTSTAITSNFINDRTWNTSDHEYADSRCEGGPANPPLCEPSQMEYVKRGSGTTLQCAHPSTRENDAGERNYNTGANWSVRGYLNPLAGGNEQTPAPGGYDLGGYTGVRVPAASGSTPGEVVLYVLVPRQRVNGDEVGTYDAGARRYQRPHGLYWVQTSHSQEAVDGCRFVINRSTWEARGWSQYLSTARFQGQGTYVVRTQGTVEAPGGNFPVVGSPRDYATSPTVSVDTDLTIN